MCDSPLASISLSVEPDSGAVVPGLEDAVRFQFDEVVSEGSGGGLDNLVELSPRAEEIDVARAEQTRQRALIRLKAITEEAEYDAVREEYAKAVTRLAVARERRSP